MNTGTTRTQIWKNNITEAITATIGWLIGRQVNVEPKEQRRLRLLSVLLVVMGLMTLSGAILLRNVSTSFWTVMLIASLVLFIGYFISRTKYHKAALVLALTVPAINPLAIFLFELPEINLLATLMWLSLPLLVSSLMMTVRKTLIVASGYIVYIALLAFLGPIHHSISIPLIAYILVIAFFVITIGVVREKDQMEMANKLKERQQAEKALRESEEKFRNLFENAKDAILIADTKTGKLLDVNIAGCKMFDLPKEEIIGKQQSEINPPEVADKYDQIFKDLIQKGSVIDQDIVVHRSDGTQINANVSANTVELGDKTIIQAIFRDMTERDKMADTIRESEEKFARVFRSSPLIMSITRVEDGKTMEINDGFTRSSGFTREDIIGRTITELGIWVNPGDRERMLDLLEKDGRVDNAEFKFRSKYGEIRLYLCSTEPINFNNEECIISIMTDITERKQMEQALRESEEKFSKAFYGSPQEMIITRAKDDVTLEVNDTFSRVTGFTREEAIGKTAEELGVWMSPEDNKRLQRTLKKQGRVNNEEYVYLNKKGEEHTELLSVEPITVSGEKCWISILADITERKKMEKELANEAIWRRILIEQSRDGIVILDQDGKVYEVNRHFSEMLGYSPEELSQMHVWDWGVGGTHEQVLEMLRTVDETGDNFEMQHRCKDGTIIDVEISTNGAVFGEEKLVFCVCRDITKRKKTEKALKESEEKFSKAFHAIPEAVSISRIKDGIHIDANEGFCRNVGRTMKEVIGQRIEEIRPWTDAKERKNIQDIQNKGRFENEEVEISTKSGEKRTLLLSGDIINIGGEPCRLLIGNDITNRIRTEQALQESEEKFSKAFHAMPEAVSITRIKDGILIDVNEGFCVNVGLTIKEVVGHRMEEIRPWADANERRKMQRIQEKGRFENEEMEIHTKSGETRTLLLSGDTINISGEPCMLLIGNDITNRIRTEQALLESEEKFSKAFHAMPEAVCIARLKDHVFIDVNESFCHANGCTPKEAIGHTADEIGIRVKPEDLELMTQLMEKQGHFKNEEFEFKLKSGEIRTILFSSDILNIGGEPCLLNVSNDITDRRRTEQALQESEEKFSKAFHAMPEGVCIARQKDGVFIDVNESFCLANGCTPEEAIGHTADEIGLQVKPEDLERMGQLMEKQGRFENEEFEFQIKSGEIRTVLLSSHIINIGGEPCLLNVSNDITERKRMKQSLRQSEDKFFKAFHDIPMALSISSMKDGKFLDVNESFCLANGCTSEEAIGHTADEIGVQLKPENLERMNQLIEKQGHFENEEFEYQTKSGEIHTVLVSSDIVNIDGEPCVLTVSNDITERKRMKQSLRQSEDKFYKAFNAFTDAVSIASLKDGVFIEINDNFVSHNGYTREETIGHTAEELNMWANPNDISRIEQLMKKDGRFDNEEFLLRMKSGEIRTVLLSADTINIDGQPCILTIGKDITERKQMEQALRESEEKFSKAFHAIPETLSLSSVKEGRLIDVNESFLKLNRLTREQTIGHTIGEIKLFGKRDNRNKLRKLSQKYHRFKDKEIEFKVKSGKMVTFLFSGDTINIAGEPYALIIGTDITSRKQAENKLQRALADLEQSSAQLQATNKELEGFSYSVSHDLRSPLRSIDGFSQALLEDYTTKLDETGQDYLNRLRNASQKMGELIDGLLKLSRLTRSEMHLEKVDLSSLANEIAARLKETSPERSIEFIIGENLTANGDPQLLRVLLENLLVNAVKFTKNTKKARIEFGIKDNGSNNTFFIQDNGAGFDMAFKDKLFGAFQRLHDATEFPGTGIGLATVQRIINRHGGNISAEGKVGKGATFYFTLN